MLNINCLLMGLEYDTSQKTSIMFETTFNKVVASLNSNFSSLQRFDAKIPSPVSPDVILLFYVKNDYYSFRALEQYYDQQCRLKFPRAHLILLEIDNPNATLSPTNFPIQELHISQMLAYLELENSKRLCLTYNSEDQVADLLQSIANLHSSEQKPDRQPTDEQVQQQRTKAALASFPI